MNNRLVITNYEKSGNTGVLMTHFIQQKPVNIQLYSKEDTGLLGNIYIGKVKNIVSNIQAAFIDIGDGVNCYYSLKESQQPFFVNEKKDNTMHINDEILVQVEREAIKQKAPCVTSKLSLTGKYMVLITNDHGINVSRKIAKSEHGRLKSWLTPMLEDSYGFIVRTNAAAADKEALMKEAMVLIQRYKHIYQIAKTRTCYSLIEEALNPCLSFLRDANDLQYDEIVTDDKKLHEEILNYFQQVEPDKMDTVRLYEDDLLALSKLYSLDTVINDTLKKQIWLKSGGFLVIEQTEACVVIDVNTGKYSGNKSKKDTLNKINQEAAIELAKQVRIRNLSGIILVDFINTEEEDTKELLNLLCRELRKDPVETRFIDMTALQIVEITRKKVRKSFTEQWTEFLGGRN
ncbi:MAG: ribonuclease E/G [Lachnospiraceae bacterium]|nr:ribonuclease E/G [Lachnospiraceae bacterium]MDD3617632.1 ribonuclease E/G [Lachnospiraceae bacterium]